ncbi:unnamed protein product [Rotaria sordida]|uniref:Uncharacterized protein n=1 Tax=Rotaria sordida TaxID=392033 RepID=A0A813UT06_9BILA|nr:unnamed protein product [Rotaria sordida]CAF0833459.1 unnamed protein product [Rotaria sordida]
MNCLAYAGCIHQFQINENGYIQIDIFEYDNNMERFINVIEKPLIPSMTMKFNKCTIVGSCLIDKGLCVLLHLITLNNSILMFLQLQSRPWSCHILYTLQIPSSIHASMKFLSINSFLSIFINEEKNQNGFYIIDNNKENFRRNIEFIQCSLLTYIYCYLYDNFYWLMGTEIDLNTKQKLIKVYYGCSTYLSSPLVSFNTNKFIPISLVDNIQDIYVINHKIQLKTRLILGDIIISSKDNRIFSSHNGIICHELSMNNLINSILSYYTIENEQLFLFIKKDIQSIEIFQYDENFLLIPYTNTNEIANYILIDDFNQIGWKQILFLKNNFNLNSFMLTDFSQIHVFQQESNYEYNTEEKFLSIDMDDADIQSSLALVQDILRKKIINADFIVNEGYFQCRQVESDIRKISNKYHIPDLSINTQTESLIQNSNISTLILQLIEINWFVYRTNLFLYVTIKNSTNIVLNSVYLFGIDKNSNKIKLFNLKTTFQTLLNEQTSFNLNSNSCLTFILTTLIELDKNIDIELYLLINDNNKIFHVSSINILIDDLINPNNERILKLNTLETESMNNLMYRQALIYLNTLFRLDINIQSTTTTTKFHLIKHFKQLLSNMGFNSINHIPNVYIRINQGNIFEHVLIHLVNEDDLIVDDLIVHFYAENSSEAMMIAKYILSKLDFQSFSLINSINSSYPEQNNQIFNRIGIELKFYIEILKQIPTIMRKIVPTSKSESYRLLKLENFQSFQNECHLTDLLLTSLVID